MCNTVITYINAQETNSTNCYPQVTVTIKTKAGLTVQATYSEDNSFGSNYNKILFDNDIQRFNGKGMKKAVGVINSVIAPALIGVDASSQSTVDDTIERALESNGIEMYVNISSPVSVCAMKAAAGSLEIPLFRYIGGARAYTLPVPEHIAVSGSNRYKTRPKLNGRPFYSFVAHGFDNIEDAHYALYELAVKWEEIISRKFCMAYQMEFAFTVPVGAIEDDAFMWDIMNQCIDFCGYKGKVGLHADLAASAFWDEERQVYSGLVCNKDLKREDLIARLLEMVDRYGFVSLQEPLEYRDYDGYKKLTAETGIEICSSDIFGNDLKLLEWCLMQKCVNAVGLKVHSFRTFSDCLKAVNIIEGYEVRIKAMDTSGESNSITDYSIGFHCGSIYMSSCIDHSNRMRGLAACIGTGARFFGSFGLGGHRFSLKNQT